MLDVLKTNKNMTDDKKMQEELIKSFNEQFAINQNNNQSTFIQLLSIILTAIVGFGYSFINFSQTNTSKLEIIDFTAIFSISEGILTLGLALVVSYAVGYRRDQLLVNDIRKKAKIFKDNENELWNVFPISFDNQKSFNELEKRTKIISWMPEFHKIFSIAFIIIQVLLLIAYLCKCSEKTFLKLNSIDVPSLIIFIFGFVFFGFSFCILRKYFIKVIKMYNENNNK